jgi:hypothetical protein
LTRFQIFKDDQGFGWRTLNVHGSITGQPEKRYTDQRECFRDVVLRWRPATGVIEDLTAVPLVLPPSRRSQRRRRGAARHAQGCAIR